MSRLTQPHRRDKARNICKLHEGNRTRPLQNDLEPHVDMYRGANEYLDPTPFHSPGHSGNIVATELSGRIRSSGWVECGVVRILHFTNSSPYASPLKFIEGNSALAFMLLRGLHQLRITIFATACSSLKVSHSQPEKRNKIKIKLIWNCVRNSG